MQKNYYYYSYIGIVILNYKIVYELFVLGWNTWNHIIVCKLFILRIVTWSYNCLLRIIISYLKPYNSLKYLKSYSVQIISNRKEYLKP